MWVSGKWKHFFVHPLLTTQAIACKVCHELYNIFSLHESAWIAKLGRHYILRTLLEQQNGNKSEPCSIGSGKGGIENREQTVKLEVKFCRPQLHRSTYKKNSLLSM